MQEYINYQWLPDYVFTKRFESYVFVYFDDFFLDAERAEIFMSFYCTVIKKMNEHAFRLYEIPASGNQLLFLEEFDVTTTNPAEIAHKILTRSSIQEDIFQQHVLSIWHFFMIRCLLVTAKNEICVYFERDLDAIVIGCSKQVTSAFGNRNAVLNIMNLQEYIMMLELYHRGKTEFLFHLKEKLLNNYS